MEKVITIVITEEQAKAVRNAIWHYEDDSGKDDIELAGQVLAQFPDLPW